MKKLVNKFITTPVHYSCDTSVLWKCMLKIHVCVSQDTPLRQWAALDGSLGCYGFEKSRSCCQVDTYIYKRGRRFATNQKAPHMYVNYVVFRKLPLEFQWKWKLIFLWPIWNENKIIGLEHLHVTWEYVWCLKPLPLLQWSSILVISVPWWIGYVHAIHTDDTVVCISFAHHQLFDIDCSVNSSVQSLDDHWDPVNTQ